MSFGLVRVRIYSLDAVRDFWSGFWTRPATCRKNGISTYRAAINMARDMRWSVFNFGIPPPMALGAGLNTTGNGPSDGPTSPVLWKTHGAEGSAPHRRTGAAARGAFAYGL